MDEDELKQWEETTRELAREQFDEDEEEESGVTKVYGFEQWLRKQGAA